MDGVVILFYVLAILAVLSALVVVVHRSPIYCALGLVNALFLIAVMFVLLDAHMVAFLQVIVYAGAIMVLFLFVIMLLATPDEAPGSRGRGTRIAAIGATVLLAAELTAVVVARRPGEGVEIPAGFGTTQALAERLFSTHLLSFELTSLLLLVAVVGAVVMARRKA
jgi:NADH-quinone oxidoreductase subunit J